MHHQSTCVQMQSKKGLRHPQKDASFRGLDRGGTKLHDKRVVDGTQYEVIPFS